MTKKELMMLVRKLKPFGNNNTKIIIEDMWNETSKSLTDTVKYYPSSNEIVFYL